MKYYSIDDDIVAIIVLDEETNKNHLVSENDNSVVLLENVDNYSYDQLMASGYYHFECEESDELTIKGGYVVFDDTVFRKYHTPEAFEKIRTKRLNMLQNSYENKINTAIRKATQDLTFGDINEIPQDVIDKREALKAEYHEKKAAIAIAKDVPELNAIYW